MGSATAATQIEGGDRNNTWFRWCETGHIHDASHCLRAADHWNRYSDDIRLMKDLNHDTYRMGLEWSRIEPAPETFNLAAIEHYRDEIMALQQNGIKPLVTLHHFSNPLWLEDAGGWENPDAVIHFIRYTRYVLEHLGDLVSDWVTINEPNVFLIYGYVRGIWPPGKKDIGSMFKAMRHVVTAHIQSYRAIHQIRTGKNFPGRTLVGVAHHLRVFDPENDQWLNRIPARLTRYLFQELFLSSMATGRFGFPLGFGQYPAGKGRFYDFIGINYYSRDMVRFKLDPGNMFGALKVNEEAETNDLGWEIYPEGLYRLCKRYYSIYQAPIFITENGICDAADSKRARFMYDHLVQIARLIGEGIPVDRYYHWSLLDNFEWLEGESARFGLVANDFETQDRIIRPSGRFYGEICREKAVTQEMIKEYLENNHRS